MSRRWIEAALIVLGLQVAGSAAADLSLPTLNGYAQYETFGYPDHGTQGQRSENFFEARLRSSGRLTSALSYRFEGRAVADDADFTAGAYSLRNASSQRPYLSVISGALDYQASDALRVSAGKQIANWSIFDGLQPANLLSTMDQSDAFREVTLGLPGVSAHYQPDTTYLDVMVVPMAFTPSRIPQGRWAIIPPQASQRQDLPPVRFDETQAGMRLGTRWGALDANIFGYVGRDYQPIFVPQLVFLGFGDYRLDIVTQYPTLRAGGINASHPLGEQIILRVESVYFNSPDRNRADFLQSVIGMEYALDDWRFVLNYFRNDQTIGAPQEVTDPGERQFFRSFLFGEARYDGGDFEARFRGGYDMTEEFLLLQPEVSYRVWGQLRVALVASFIDANRPSYFNSIRNEDRIGTRLRYYL